MNGAEGRKSCLGHMYVTTCLSAHPESVSSMRHLQYSECHAQNWGEGSPVE